MDFTYRFAAISYVHREPRNNFFADCFRFHVDKDDFARFVHGYLSRSGEEHAP